MDAHQIVYQSISSAKMMNPLIKHRHAALHKQALMIHPLLAGFSWILLWPTGEIVWGRRSAGAQNTSEWPDRRTEMSPLLCLIHIDPGCCLKTPRWSKICTSSSGRRSRSCTHLPRSRWRRKAVNLSDCASQAPTAEEGWHTLATSAGFQENEAVCSDGPAVIKEDKVRLHKSREDGGGFSARVCPSYLG